MNTEEKTNRTRGRKKNDGPAKYTTEKKRKRERGGEQRNPNTDKRVNSNEWNRL